MMSLGAKETQEWVARKLLELMLSFPFHIDSNKYLCMS